MSDSAISLVVDTPAQQDLDLIDATRTALDAAIEAAIAGAMLGESRSPWVSSPMTG